MNNATQNTGAETPGIEFCDTCRCEIGADELYDVPVEWNQLKITHAGRECFDCFQTSEEAFDEMRALFTTEK